MMTRWSFNLTFSIYQPVCIQCRFTWIGVPPAPCGQKGQPPGFRHLLCSGTHRSKIQQQRTRAKKKCCDSIVVFLVQHTANYSIIKKKQKTCSGMRQLYLWPSLSCLTWLTSHPHFPHCPVSTESRFHPCVCDALGDVNVSANRGWGNPHGQRFQIYRLQGPGFTLFVA